MSCYVCLEECNDESPCECKHLVHETCLHRACKSQNIIHCTICKSNLVGYVFKTSSISENNNYNIIGSSDSDSDTDSNDSIDFTTTTYIEVSYCKYYLFYFLWWIFLSTMVSIIYGTIICISNICHISGYGEIFGASILIEFIIIFCRYNKCIIG